MREILTTAYDRLLAAYGPQGWWPAESALEVMVGAVLVQNTAWVNVERAMDQLRARDLLDARRLYDLPPTDLETLIRPAGAFRVKARRLRNLLRLIVDDYGGSLESLLGGQTEPLRTALLKVNGIGPETADSILLYAAQRPRFVVDAYTRRVLERHGWIGKKPTYEAMQQLFERHLDPEPSLFNEYHALLVAVGKHHCRPQPQCEGCPLESMLPAP